MRAGKNTATIPPQSEEIIGLLPQTNRLVSPEEIIFFVDPTPCFVSFYARPL